MPAGEWLPEVRARGCLHRSLFDSRCKKKDTRHLTMAGKLQVKDYMSRRLTTLKPETEIIQAVHTLIKKNISGAPVLDADGKLIGMITQIDCLKVVLNAAYHSEYGGTVAELMSTEIESMHPDESMIEAAKRFLEKRYHRFPVLDNGELVGLISRRDVLRALGDAWQ
jgi:CBS domain-containing protein